MEDFTLWFSTGFGHITDWSAIDHILFLIMMCMGYRLHEWKKVLILVTAFTAGHSLTLILSAFNLISIPSSLVEILIPFTIMFSAVFAVIRRNKTSISSSVYLYSATLAFGFIHGLGFSMLLKSMLGSEENIIQPLFFFNLGIEAAQLLILAAFFVICLPLQPVFRISRDRSIFYASSAVFIIAIYMAAERITNLYN